jgi:alkylation response protein AidB-like acyl-CoA dehydrogenase
MAEPLKFFEEKPANTERIKGGSWLLEPVGARRIFIYEHLTEEQKQFGQTTSDFIKNEVLPKSKDIEEQKPGLSPSLLKKAGEVGLLMAEIPDQYGGLGLDKITSTVIAENSTGQGSFSVSFMCHTGIGTLPILYFGTEEQKQKYLPKLATAEMIGAYALTEAGSGSDALAAKTKAVLSPDGKHYILNGEKMFITNGSFADLITVFAKIDGEQFTAFLIEKDFPGVSHGPEEKKMGIKGSSTTTIILQDAKIPVENVLGEIGRGHKIAFNVLNIGRWKLAAACMGKCKETIAYVTKYVKDRKQFGQPLADFELIQRKLADCAIRTFVLESVVLRYAGMVDEAVALLDKASPDYQHDVMKAIEEYAIEASISKIVGSENLSFIADEAVQMLGGYGFIEEYPVTQTYRDCRINRIFEGTNEINRLIIPGTLLKRAMKGELDLMGEIQRILGQLKEGFPMVADKGPLTQKINLVNQAKKLCIYLSGVAVQKYMADIKDRETFMAEMADFILETFAMESALLRSLQLIEEQGEEKSRIPIAITKTYVTEKCLELKARARQFMANVAKGDATNFQKYDKAIHRIMDVTPVDTISACHEIAGKVIEAEAYSL